MSPPRLLLCGFDAFPEAPINPSSAVVRGLASSAWSPPGVALDFLTLPVAWRASVETILDRLAGDPVDGVLVVGVAVEADAFRIETLGRNRAARARPDHAGELWPQDVIRLGAPETLPATAPWTHMLEALQQTGLPVRASDDAGDYLCNFTLYQLLAEAAAPATGFLHVPQARECDPAAAFDLADIEAAVRACASAFAAHLAGIRGPAASRRTA